MTDGSQLLEEVQSRLRSRSMGVKLMVVCALALLMSIPGFFVESLVQDRTQRAQDVVNEISGYVGGQQTFLGPTLAVPYTIPPASPAETARHGIYLVFPAQASATIKTTTEQRRRSLFKVPVFQADLQLESKFDLTGVPAAAPAGAQMDWSRAEFIVGVSDARGAQADAQITVDGKTSAMAPAQLSDSLTLGPDNEQHLRLSLFAANANDIQRTSSALNVSASLRFSGAQRIAVLAYGKSTHVAMQGDWPSPGFDGGFLPVNRTVSPHGFTADWTVPFIARGVRAEGSADSIAALQTTALGVSFIEVADPYQSVNRALKYIALFIGLVFLTYFLFEVTTGKRVHPSQYVLVGIAQIIFYLLLLSIAERIGFDFAFLIAGAATVLLLSANVGWVFDSRLQAVRAGVVFALLYTMIYLLLRLEDNALLVGAVASFIAIAAVMYLTRRIDWYSAAPGANPDVPGQMA